MGATLTAALQGTGAAVGTAGQAAVTGAQALASKIAALLPQAAPTLGEIGKGIATGGSSLAEAFATGGPEAVSAAIDELLSGSAFPGPPGNLLQGVASGGAGGSTLGTALKTLSAAKGLQALGQRGTADTSLTAEGESAGQVAPPAGRLGAILDPRSAVEAFSEPAFAQSRAAPAPGGGAAPVPGGSQFTDPSTGIGEALKQAQAQALETGQLTPGAEAGLAQDPGFGGQLLQNFKDVGTFAKERPGAFLAAATNNFGTGSIGGSFLKDTPFDAFSELEDGTLTPEQLGGARDFVAGVGGSAGGPPPPPPQDGEQQPDLGVQGGNQLAQQFLGAGGPAIPQFIAEGAEGGALAPRGGDSRVAQNQAALVPEEEQIDFEAPGSIAGPFGGQRIGQRRFSDVAAARTTAERRAAGLSEEFAEPNVTSGIGRFFIEALKRTHPIAGILPSRPIATFPEITAEQIATPEFQKFLAETENDPFRRAAAFSTSTAALNSLLTLPQAQFKALFPSPQGFTLGDTRFETSRATGLTPRGGGTRVVAENPDQLTFIGTGNPVKMSDGEVLQFEKGQVVHMDQDRGAALVNSRAVLQFPSNENPLERVQLSDGDGNLVNRTKAQIQAFSPAENEEFFGATEFAPIPGRDRQTGEERFFTRSQVAQLGDRVEPLNRATTEVNVNANLQLPSESNAEKRGKIHAAAIQGIVANSRLLDIVKQAPPGVGGFRGGSAQFLGGLFGSVDKQLGDTIASTIVGGDVEVVDLSELRAGLTTAATRMIPVVSGQDLGRVSEGERKLAFRIAGIDSFGASRETIVGALRATTQLMLINDEILRISEGAEPNFPVGTDAEVDETVSLLTDLGFDFEEKKNLIKRLGQTHSIVSRMNLGVGVSRRQMSLLEIEQMRQDDAVLKVAPF